MVNKRMWRLHLPDGRAATLFCGRSYSIGREFKGQDDDGAVFIGGVEVPESCKAVSRQHGYFMVSGYPMPLPAEPGPGLERPWLTLDYFDKSPRGSMHNGAQGVQKKVGEKHAHQRLHHGDTLTLGFCRRAPEESGGDGASGGSEGASSSSTTASSAGGAIGGAISPSMAKAIAASLEAYNADPLCEGPGAITLSSVYSVVVEWVPLRLALSSSTTMPQMDALLRSIGAMPSVAWPSYHLPAIPPCPSCSRGGSAAGGGGGTEAAMLAAVVHLSCGVTHVVSTKLQLTRRHIFGFLMGLPFVTFKWLSAMQERSRSAAITDPLPLEASFIPPIGENNEEVQKAYARVHCAHLTRLLTDPLHEKRAKCGIAAGLAPAPAPAAAAAAGGGERGGSQQPPRAPVVPSTGRALDDIWWRADLTADKLRAFKVLFAEGAGGGGGRGGGEGGAPGTPALPSYLYEADVREGTVSTLAALCSALGLHVMALRGTPGGAPAAPPSAASPAAAAAAGAAKQNTVPAGDTQDLLPTQPTSGNPMAASAPAAPSASQPTQLAATKTAMDATWKRQYSAYSSSSAEGGGGGGGWVSASALPRWHHCV